MRATVLIFLAHAVVALPMNRQGSAMTDFYGQPGLPSHSSMTEPLIPRSSSFEEEEGGSTKQSGSTSPPAHEAKGALKSTSTLPGLEQQSQSDMHSKALKQFDDEMRAKYESAPPQSQGAWRRLFAKFKTTGA